MVIRKKNNQNVIFYIQILKIDMNTEVINV